MHTFRAPCAIEQDGKQQQVETHLGTLQASDEFSSVFRSFLSVQSRPPLINQGRREMACRLGSCEINNNKAKAKKAPAKKSKKVVVESSFEWSDSSESCSGCSACEESSSSSCSCSECNVETESSDDCYSCRPKERKQKKSKKVLQCKDGVCEWVRKKPKKASNAKAKATKKAAPKSKKAKKC